MENKRGYLTDEQIEELRKLKGKISANQARKRYRIGHDKLFKIWGDSITDDDQPYAADDILKSVDNRVATNNDLNDVIYKKKPTPEDLIYNLETIADQSRKQTELLSRLLEKQEVDDNMKELLDAESEILEEEEEQTDEVQGVDKQIAGLKKMWWQSLALMAVVNTVLLTWANSKSKDYPPPTAGLTDVKPPPPPPKPKKEHDIFDFP